MRGPVRASSMLAWQLRLRALRFQLRSHLGWNRWMTWQGAYAVRFCLEQLCLSDNIFREVCRILHHRNCLEIFTLFYWQPAIVPFSHTKSVPATSQPVVLCSHSKLAPTSSHNQQNRVIVFSPSSRRSMKFGRFIPDRELPDLITEAGPSGIQGYYLNIHYFLRKSSIYNHILHSS